MRTQTPVSFPQPSALVMHNLIISGRRTSVRLEPVMWEALNNIARQREQSVHELATEIDQGERIGSLTAAIRVFIVAFYQAAAALGQASTGHTAGSPSRFGGGAVRPQH